MRNAAALCLPTVSAVALGVYLLVDTVPEIDKAERARVRLEYREAAAEMRQEPEKFRVAEFSDGWKSAGKMAPGKWGYDLPSTGRLATVWYTDGKKTIARLVEPVEETGHAAVFAVVVSFFIFVIVLLTFFGVRFFIRYARERDEFVAATVHDLTTPLVGMRLSAGKSDDDVNALVERMVNLVENLKAFLHLGGRRADPKVQRVDVLAACREAYAPFREDFREYYDGRDVPVECAGGEAYATADMTLTVQILWNLFGNALKYAAPHGKVELAVEATESAVRVSFRDEGPGMTARERKRVFERYFRGKGIASSGKGGFGIGLCIAREFARSMGGDLTVSPNGSKGCVFTLELPK